MTPNPTPTTPPTPAPATPATPATPRYAVFAAGQRIATGTEAELSAVLITAVSGAPVLVFDLETGEQIELPTAAANTPSTHAQTASPQGNGATAPEPPGATPAPARPGRPRLGVVAREVTLMPQDWEWLAAQPGGASVALRKLVLKARRAEAGRDQRRQAQVACYRFITAIAGNEPGFEEATRALFTDQPERFASFTENWPPDVRALAHQYAAAAWTAAPAPAATAPAAEASA